MASQVLSGTGNVSYTNNTGQNVRIVINFYSEVRTINWAGLTHIISNFGNQTAILGRNLAFSTSAGGAADANNMQLYNTIAAGAAPTELMLAPGQTFSVSATSTGIYNIVVIPEAG